MAKKGAGTPPTSTSRIVVMYINSWQEFYEVVSGPKYRNWAFRGHSDAEWPLYSSLSRYLKEYGVHRNAWPSQELKIGRLFRRSAHLFLEHVPDESDTFQWLALMQHHGAPTRLVDFTWSPFVAAFFALERATKDAAVWAICVPAISEAAHRIRFPWKNRMLDPHELDLRHPGAYEDLYVLNEVPFVSSGEPRLMNKRQVAQSGTFIVPGVLDQPIEEILAAYPKAGTTVAKFVLRTPVLRSEAMRALYSMQLTNASLFPDLDGLAKSMAYELELHWAYNPKTMRTNPGN